MRTIIVGDIHGHYLKLARLLEKGGFDSEKDTLIINGDLMDRGPDSYECLTLIKELKYTMGKRLIYIRGSHEYALLNWDRFPKCLFWNIIGRRQTIQSFRKHGCNLSGAKRWIAENTVLYFKGDGFQCAHAAIKSAPIEDNDIRTLMLNHKLTRKNLYIGPLTVTGHIHLKQPMYFSGEGTDGTVLPYDVECPLPKTGIICIDTCSKEPEALTAMLIRAKTFSLKSDI